MENGIEAVFISAAIFMFVLGMGIMLMMFYRISEMDDHLSDNIRLRDEVIVTADIKTEEAEE